MVIDRFGNAVIQKAIRVFPRLLKKQVVEYLKGSIVSLSKNTYGSFCLEMIVEYVPLFVMDFFPDEVKEKTMEMAKHVASNRVLQKIIICFPECQISEILETLYSNIEELLYHATGTWVVQAMMAKNKKHRNRVVEIISHKLFDLSQTEPGKRTVKKALKLATPNQRWMMIQQVIDRGAIAWLYLDEWGKEVVKTMIKTADWSSQRRYFINQLNEPMTTKNGKVTTLWDM